MPWFSRAASSRGRYGDMGPPSLSVPASAITDLHLAHAGRGGALGDVVGKQSERLFAFAARRPPDRVAAGAARGEGRLVPKRAAMPRKEANTTPHSCGSWLCWSR